MLLILIIVIQIILVFLKIDGYLNWDWMAIFIPSFPLLIMWLKESVKEYRRMQAAKDFLTPENLEAIYQNDKKQTARMADSTTEDAASLANQLLSDLVDMSSINTIHTHFEQGDSYQKCNQHQRALRIAIFFYIKDDDKLKKMLTTAQLSARLIVLDWNAHGLVTNDEMMTFENALYERYK